MKKNIFIIVVLFVVSLAITGCSGDSDNVSGNDDNDSNVSKNDDNANTNNDGNDSEDSDVNRDDFDAEDLMAIRTAKAGDQAENKIAEHSGTLGYYDVLDDVDVNEAFSTGDIHFSIEKMLLAKFIPYEDAEMAGTLNEIAEFPMTSVILVIDTDAEGDSLTEPDVYMAVSSADVKTQDGQDLSRVNELDPQVVGGGEDQSTLNVFRMDNGADLEDVDGITFTIDPQFWTDEGTEDDKVTKAIYLN